MSGPMVELNPRPVTAERRSFRRWARRLTHHLRGHQVLPWGDSWLLSAGKSRRLSRSYACVTCDMDL